MDNQRDSWIVFAGTPHGAIDNRNGKSIPFYTYDEAEQHFFKMRAEGWVMRAEIYHYPANSSEYKEVLKWVRS